MAKWPASVLKTRVPVSGDQALRITRQGQAGTSTGLNISPGSDDDGWIVPQPVHLSDGTRVQLYKDGEALHAGDALAFA